MFWSCGPFEYQDLVFDYWDYYDVLFDAQGGSSVSSKNHIKHGDAITLPYTSRDGYTFAGWYTAATGGTHIGGAGNSYTVWESITLYARWTRTVISGGSGEEGETRVIKGIECVLVKAGTFTMGDYWVSKYPVTQKQYKKAMGYNPSRFSGGDNPVECVSWVAAVLFCKEIGARLLTEAEWEFAARGGNRSNGYIYSGSNNVDEVAWHWGNSSSGTKPVGQKKPNELGIYDMSGNVWEWCSDWYGDYPTGAVTDPVGPSSGSGRVYRGGSWSDISQYCRVALRDDYSPSGSNYNLGLRVAFNSN